MCLDLLKDSCGEAVMRLTIFILNGIFLLIALIFIGFGLFLEVEYTKFEHATDDKFGATPAGIIVIGAFMLIVSGFGIWGVIRKSKCLTGFYGAALIIVLIAQLCAVVTPIIATAESEEILEKTGYKTISEWDGVNGQISKSWNAIQNNLNCCGVKSYSDWINSTTFQDAAHKLGANASIPVPDSCCVDYKKNCGLFYTDDTILKTSGCMVEIETWVKQHISVLCGALAIVCVTELVAMIIAFHLVKSGFSYERLA